MMLLRLIVRHEELTHPFDEVFIAEASGLNSLIKIIKNHERQIGFHKRSIFYDKKCRLCIDCIANHEILAQTIQIDLMISGADVVSITRNLDNGVITKSSKPLNKNPIIRIQPLTEPVNLGCPECGTEMVPNGACYKCNNCGYTSGCS